MTYIELLATDQFEPRSINDGKNFMLGDDNQGAINAIINQKYKLICLNDTVNITNFEQVKDEITDAFNNILSIKSSFEI